MQGSLRLALVVFILDLDLTLNLAKIIKLGSFHGGVLLFEQLVCLLLVSRMELRKLFLLLFDKSKVNLIFRHSCCF